MLLALAMIVSDAPALADGKEAPDASDSRIARGLLSTPAVTSERQRAKNCGKPGSDGEIVVCAQDDSQFRALSSAEADPKSPQALDDGRLHAPDFSGGSCEGEFGCITGGWAPPPVYMIDLKAIPEPPPGSDADKVAKGQMRAR